jgi:hypothetical protein
MCSHRTPVRPAKARLQQLAAFSSKTIHNSGPIAAPVAPQPQGIGWRAAKPRESTIARSGAPPFTRVRDVGQPSELQRLINSIPYRKLCIWSFVVLLTWPLHEFFGVRWRAKQAKRRACGVRTHPSRMGAHGSLRHQPRPEKPSVGLVWTIGSALPDLRPHARPLANRAYRPSA